MAGEFDPEDEETVHSQIVTRDTQELQLGKQEDSHQMPWMCLEAVCSCLLEPALHSPWERNPSGGRLRVG